MEGIESVEPSLLKMKVTPIGEQKEPINDEQALVFNFPKFDCSNYYGIAGEVAQLASKNSEADPIAVYLSFLTTCSALLGRHCYIQIGDTRHYPRLFSALVGASSRARKGTSFKPVQRLIREAEQVYFQRIKQRAYDSLNITEGGLSSAEGLIYEVRDEAEQTKGKDKQPLWEAVEDKRLLVVEEELANVLKISQREGNTLSPLLRKAWDGGVLAPMTKNNRLKASNPHINVLAHITQYELKHLLSASDIYNGLCNRFLWACVRRTKKLAFPKPMDSQAVAQLAVKISARIINCEAEREIVFSESAQQYWEEQYRLISVDKAGIIGSVTSRAETYVLRLSLLFCLLDNKETIEIEHLKASMTLVNYCNESVNFIFSTPADGEAGTDADKILKALAIKPHTQTEVSRLFNGHKTRIQLSTLLGELQMLNKIQSNQEKGTKKIIWELIC